MTDPFSADAPPPTPCGARSSGPVTVSPSMSTEAAVLLQARGDDLTDLAASAARVRDAGLAAAGRPGVITYSRKVFIPLTRLCRDKCHYCTFVTVPGKLRRRGPRDVPLARRGAGHRPQGRGDGLQGSAVHPRRPPRGPLARGAGVAGGARGTTTPSRTYGPWRSGSWRRRACCPHLNPGVLTWTDLQRLKPVAPSMGMMLETTATRLWSEPGGPHHGSPDKEPAVRLRVLEDAGRSNVPFTTGILIGIGESYEERADSLFELRKTARAYHGIQEVIVQNFRAKPDTAMRGMPDAELEELAAAIAVARHILGPSARIQAPPNLVDAEYALLIGAGIDDWGGVSPLTPDHVNPERPWPHIDELAAEDRGVGLPAPRTPHHLPGVHPARRALARPPPPPARPRPGRPGDGPRPRGRTPRRACPGRSRTRASPPPAAPTCTPPSTPRAAPATAATTSTRCTGTGRRCARRRRPAWSRPASTPTYGQALSQAADDPTKLTDDQALALLHADGPALDELCRIADALRRDVVGDEVTYIVTRNINFTNVCYTGCRFCAFAQRRTDADAYTLSLDQVADRAAQAWDVGAVEVCMQGGIHPDLPGHGVLRHRAGGEGARPRHARARVLADGGRQRRDPHRDVDPRLADGGQGGRARLDPRHGGGDPGRRGPLGPHQGQAARRPPGSRSSGPRTRWACARPRR